MGTVNAVDTLTEIIKSRRVGFSPTVKELETLLAQMCLEGLTASPVPTLELAEVGDDA
jgi:hypothetical protein